jgi:hypothetical protein
MDNHEGKAYREHRAHHTVTLRRWSIPVTAALCWCLVWPLLGAVALAAAISAVPPPVSQLGEKVFGVAAVTLYAMCLGCAVRSLRARVVITADELCVHNNLSTVRAAWSEVEKIEEVQLLNTQALWHGDWYGVAVRIRGRRRPVHILASWSQHPEYANAFAERLRSHAQGPGTY